MRERTLEDWIFDYWLCAQRINGRSAKIDPLVAQGYLRGLARAPWRHPKLSRLAAGVLARRGLRSRKVKES